MNKISPINILLTVFIISLVTAMPAAAGTVTTIDFEDLSEGDGIEDFGTHYSGVTFSGADDIGIAVVPNYNYVAYPPHSGINVVAFHFGSQYNPTELRATFDQSVKRAGLWYTSYGPVALEAYDKNNQLIASINGDPNIGTSTYLEVQESNIAYIVFHDDSNYIVCDDLTYETEDDVSIPEFPSVVLPIAAIMGLMFVFQRRKE